MAECPKESEVESEVESKVDDEQRNKVDDCIELKGSIKELRGE